MVQQRLFMATVMTLKTARLAVDRQRNAAVRTVDHLSAIGTLEVARKPSTIVEQNRLLTQLDRHLQRLQ